jgi:hypothetical protein
MTQSRLRSALLILQWALGLVILGESLRFALSAEGAQAFAKTGLPNFIHAGSAWAEIAAAALFLVPRTTVGGGWLLIAVLGLAAVIHILHGWFDVGALVVYATATWVVMAGKSASAEKRT